MILKLVICAMHECHSWKNNGKSREVFEINGLQKMLMITSDTDHFIAIGHVPLVTKDDGQRNKGSNESWFFVLHESKRIDEYEGYQMQNTESMNYKLRIAVLTQQHHQTGLRHRSCHTKGRGPLL